MSKTNYTVNAMVTAVHDYFDSLCDDCYARKEYNRYKELDDQGRLVVLPSAIGGKVYRIVAIECEDCPSYDGKTDLHEWTCEQDRCPQKIVEDRFEMWMLTMAGRLVFATRPEAEAAIAHASDVPDGGGV